MSRKTMCKLLLGAAGLALAGCGGGGGGGNKLVLTPPPPPPPPPSPPAPAPGPLEVAPFGVTSTTDFATVGAEVKVRWNAEIKAYEVTVPGQPTGKVVPNQVGSTLGQLVGAGGESLPVKVFIRPTGPAWKPYSYTSWMEAGPKGAGESPVAFGIPTPAGSIPTTGTASYKAEISGVTRSLQGADYGLLVQGDALFHFDFGAGKLSGYMAPQLNGPMDVPGPLPTYHFVNTIYSSGSTTFSGAFDIGGPIPSSFQGRFAGPLAQELMAGWRAPFVGWENQWGVMEGVMIGKRE